ncbi:hypothetical protein [Gordonia sp. NB41Y]|uniref:hypothetical protein n=1 Tax=Gordonia sp. NB41Y TaxID=875808 RepID=UPI00128FA1B1|nr:hypothetical protein [Gordonia sp. NB41Y]WLP91054.1 hypothetical protein Q9K23_01825 [Gordonia sp. NB41Y]
MNSTSGNTTVLALLATAVVLVSALVVAVILVVDAEGDDRAAAPSAVNGDPTTVETSTSSVVADSSPAGSPASPGQATPPVPGADVGAGGPRPATAQPLPTYVSRYGKLRSAHLVTPTGRIGCDFNQPDAEGAQGLCGITSFNKSSSPLGCVTRSGTCKGRWIFPLAANRVDAPTDGSGTTGWMNQPATDGYQVPVAAYGNQYYFDDWVCASESNGLTCWNTTTGSGVFLAVEQAVRFDGP